MANSDHKQTHRLAVIDIGSNSVRLVIYDVFGVAFTPIYSEKVLAGLGRNLHVTGKLDVQGRALAFAALQRFKTLLDAEFNAANRDKILIAATAALRDASDAHDFIEHVRQDIGFDIRPLSGEREAYMSAMGVIAGDSRAHGIVADLGGASLELIAIKDRKPVDGRTYPLGPFSVFKGKFDPVGTRALITKHFVENTVHKKGQDLYLIGGAWRNLISVHQKRTGYPLRVAQNFALNVEQTKELGRWAYSPEGQAEIMNWRGLSSARADTLPYSGLLLDVLLGVLKPRNIIIASGGLREGVVYNAIAESTSGDLSQFSELFDGCYALAKGRGHGKNFGIPLYNFINTLGGNLPCHFDGKNKNRLRRAACLLSGIGKGLHPSHKARMVFRTVLYAPLPGLTHPERAYLALMLFCSYTSKTTTPNDAALMHLLSVEAQNSARIYGEAMRFGIVISGRSEKILSQLSMRIVDDGIAISPQPLANTLLTQHCKARLTVLENYINSNAR